MEFFKKLFGKKKSTKNKTGTHRFPKARARPTTACPATATARPSWAQKDAAIETQLKTLELKFVYTGPGFPSDPPQRLEYLQALLDTMKDVAPRMSPGVPEDWGQIVEARHQTEPPGVQLLLRINPSCEDILRQIYSKEWERLCAFLRKRKQ